MQRREVESNIISSRENKFDIQQKSMQYPLYYIFTCKKTNKMKKYQFNPVYGKSPPEKMHVTETRLSDSYKSSSTFLNFILQD